MFAFIGTSYGAGNGSSTFNLPDLRGEFIRGFDNGRGVDSGRSVASSQGSQNDSHNHSVSITTSTTSLTGTITKISETYASGGGGATGVFTKGSSASASNTPSRVDSSPAGSVSMDASHNHSVSGNTANQGGNESRPRNIAMMYIIKT